MAPSGGSTVGDLEKLGWVVVICRIGESLSEGIRANSVASSRGSNVGPAVFGRAVLSGC